MISDRARFGRAFFLGVFFCAALGVGFAVGPPPFALAKMSESPPVFLSGFQTARSWIGYAAGGIGILSGIAVLSMHVYIRRRRPSIRPSPENHAESVIDRAVPPSEHEKPTSPAAKGSASK